MIRVVTNEEWARTDGFAAQDHRYVVSVLSPRAQAFRPVMLTNDRERAFHMRMGLIAEDYPMPIVEDRHREESWRW